MRRWLTLTGAYLAIVAVCALTVFLNHDQDAEICRTQRENREVLRHLVVIATEGGTSLDFTTVPGFDTLDEETQAFLNNLASVSPANGRSAALRAEMLEQIPPIEC